LARIKIALKLLRCESDNAYVTHDRAEAGDIATNIVCMRHGRIERSIPIEEFKIGQRP